MSELTTRPAVALLEMLRSGAISSEELVREHLREIDRLNPTLRAFVDVSVERALAAARTADAMRHNPHTAQLPLLGLPVSTKSSINVAGLRCETGTVLHRGMVPEQDAVAVAKLKAAGAIVLGTTNCPEFLMAYETDNRLYGATANPWDTTRSAGGSSGGEAAAIAAGLSAGGLGSDSGGSVREPAHFTGICSLKPTPSRISSEGHTLPCVGPFTTLGAIGLMARTIADVELLYDVLRERDAGSVTPIKPDASLLQKPIGVLEDDNLAPVTAETRVAVRAAAQALLERGFHVEPFASAHLESARRLWWTFFMRCGRILLEPVIAGRESELSPTFRYFLDTARREPLLGSEELLTAWTQWDPLRTELNAELACYTAVLTPVCSIPAFRHGERNWMVEGEPLECFQAMRFTQWFNVLGAPAAVVPVGRSTEGLPIGVQVASVPFADEAVLYVARQLDEDFGYRVPPLALE